METSEEILILHNRLIDLEAVIYTLLNTLEALNKLERANAERIETLSQDFEERVTSTSDIIEAWNATNGAIKFGAVVGRFIAWVAGLAVVGSGFAWVASHFKN